MNDPDDFALLVHVFKFESKLDQGPGVSKSIIAKRETKFAGNTVMD